MVCLNSKANTMDTLQAILTRRSIRKYSDKPIEASKIETVLKAAMHAPSAFDQQAWHFVSITGPETLGKIPEVHSHSDLVKEAPACILVCFDPSLEKLPGFWQQDCAAATQNLLLAAHDQGLGAVWIGVHPTKENEAGLRQLLKIPETIIPFALIALGEPDEPYPDKNPYNPERVHKNIW
jgi:nitroreductase